MAVDMFLELEGIKGESKDHKHAGKIDILAFSWGASQTGTMSKGGGGGAGKVNVQDISVTKFVDKSSPPLVAQCCSGKHIPKATLIVRKAGDKPLEYLTYKFFDVLVTSVSTGGSGGEERLTENLSLNFSKFECVYKEQNKTGGQEGGDVKMGWDVAANKPV